MKQCVKHLAAAVLVFVLLAVFAGSPRRGERRIFRFL